MPDDFTLLLLRNRGIESKEEIEKFLNPSYDEHLHDPLLMKNMPEAAERLAKAIVSGERICAWTDYDCDGIPAAVLLYDFLESFDQHHEDTLDFPLGLEVLIRLSYLRSKTIPNIRHGVF